MFAKLWRLLSKDFFIGIFWCYVAMIRTFQMGGRRVRSEVIYYERGFCAVVLLDSIFCIGVI